MSAFAAGFLCALLCVAALVLWVRIALKLARRRGGTWWVL